MNTFLIFANILQLLSDMVFFTLYSFFLFISQGEKIKRNNFSVEAVLDLSFSK